MRRRKFLMKQVWRIQQSQSLIMMAFWVMGLPAIFYPYIRDYLDTTMGITDQTIGLTFLGFIILSMILTVGFMYDRIFKLWATQMDVIVHRNQYALYRFYPKDQEKLNRFFLPLARAVQDLTGDQELKSSLARVQSWVDKGSVSRPYQFRYDK